MGMFAYEYTLQEVNEVGTQYGCYVRVSGRVITQTI
jgi:hypothetical protein